MLRAAIFITILRRQQQHRRQNERAQGPAIAAPSTSASRSHAAIAGSNTSRARHARPAVVTGVAAGTVVLPACLGAPCAAVGGDVQLHECSPLGRSGGGNDTHSDTPLAHVDVKDPPNTGERTHPQRTNGGAVGAVAVRAPRTGVTRRQQAAPADRQTGRQRTAQWWLYYCRCRLQRERRTYDGLAEQW
jgi:hypothetical protein